ncbi:hypothetical protein BBD46_06385 [Natrialba sp. SSL1]|nr:hypothetical protein BBD46_06385 [Natrialba sp. SSL1]
MKGEYLFLKQTFLFLEQLISQMYLIHANLLLLTLSNYFNQKMRTSSTMILMFLKLRHLNGNMNLDSSQRIYYVSRIAL